jgi:F-type H+-transporting ATPase subunit b
MNILDNFGFNPILFTAQIINFVIIFFVLKKILYKPVMDTLKKRDEEIKKGLKDKEDAEKLLLEAEEKESKILKDAQTKAEKIIADAKLEATDTKAQIEESARKEAEKMLSQARETIVQETKAAEDHLTAKIGTIAIGLLEKSLTGIFGKKEQELVLKKAEAELKRQKAV